MTNPLPNCDSSELFSTRYVFFPNRNQPFRHNCYITVLHPLSIDWRTLRYSLENIGWTNALIAKENVYSNLVRVFYSIMDISAASKKWVITNVSGIPIEFHATGLNGILGTRDGGYNVYASRSRLDFPWYSHTIAVKNICRQSDFSNEDCNGTLKSEALCPQVQMLHNVLQHVISPRKGHGDEVTRLDVKF